MEPEDTNETAPSSAANVPDTAAIDAAIETKESAEDSAMDALMDGMVAKAQAEAAEHEKARKALDAWTPAVPCPRGELPRKIAQIIETIERSANDIGTLVIGINAKPGKKLTMFGECGQGFGMVAAIDAENTSPNDDNLGVQKTPGTIGAIEILKHRAGL